MGSRTVSVVAGLLILGAIGLALYLKPWEHKGPGQETQAGSAPAETSSGAVSATEAPAEPTKKKRTNMNPDLSTDDKGLSKAVAVIETNRGTIRYRFYSKDAPYTVKRIIELINTDFYDGLTFHRVEPNFVIQGGDPDGNGTGGSGRKLKAEFNGKHHMEGTVAMARAQHPDSADSQFYITLAPQPQLDGNYTVFGQVIEGMDVVKRIQVGDRMTSIYVE